MASPRINEHIRYEPEEKCSPWLSLAVGGQGILLVLAPTVLIIAITVLAAGQGEEYLTWSVFAGLIIVGIVTALQASRLGRFGAGHVVITGVTPNYIAVSILALAAGGPAMLASLIVLSGIFFIAVATWLPYLRRVITPTVSGTVLMLIAATIVPVAIDRIQDAPEGPVAGAGLIVAATTLLVAASLALRAPRLLRPWSLILGIAAGCVVAGALGIYELDRFHDAPWFGIPDLTFPGLDFTPSASFFALLPMFLIVTLIQAIKWIGDSIAIQRTARRNPRSTDFRLLQGSIYVSGVGTVLSGIAGTPPTTLYSALTASLVNLTGVAARSVGYAIAAIVIVLVLLPKLTGALLTVPNPVMGAFLLIALGILFVEGAFSVMRGGMDASKVFVVGLSFAVGMGMESQNVFEGILASPWDSLLGSGILGGTVTAIGITLYLNLTNPRPKRTRAKLDMSDLPRIDAFMKEVAEWMGWEETSTERLRSAGEEAFSSLMSPENEFATEESDGKTPQLLITARREAGAVELELISVVEEENLGDRLAYLGEQEESVDGREVSFRLLRHYASSVSHQKYHGMDIVTVRVER